jgi:hypothetical protein
MLTVGIIHVLWMLISKIQKNNVQCGCFFFYLVYRKGRLNWTEKEERDCPLL